MPLAGTDVSAADITWRSGAAVLTDKNSFSGTVNFEDWGTETIQFDDPGVPVAIVATASGNALATAGGTTYNASTRIAISVDGGSTFTTNTSSTTFVEINSSNISSNGTSQCFRLEAEPTGDIVVKLQMQVSNAANVKGRNGYLTAIMHPV